MKNIGLGVVFCLVSVSAYAELSKDEGKRLNEAATVLTELRHTPEGIPDQLWAKAECVLVIPSMKKAAFIVGGEYGSGVMSCRKNGWTAPIFMQLAKGSWGLQIGAEEVDLVLLVMNRRGLDKLLQDKVSLGADASVAAGPVGRSANAATDAQMSAEMVAYSRSQGVFGGIDVSGGVLKTDNEAQARAYGSSITARDVVMGTTAIAAPSAASAFLRALGADADSR